TTVVVNCFGGSRLTTLEWNSNLVCANGDTSHCHRSAAETGSCAIDPANFLAILLARALSSLRLCFRLVWASLLIQPAICAGLTITSQTSPILGFIAGPKSLTLGKREGARRCKLSR